MPAKYRDRAPRVITLEDGVASDQALQLGIEESPRLSGAKQSVPISRVADFSLAREVYREVNGR